jgi:hemolysin activation/secretion protein
VLANNYRSPSVGSEQGQVFLRHINLTGHSDVLSAGYNKTDGMDSGSLSYSFPITRLQTRVNLFYSAGDTVVVEAPFDLIDLESETDTAGIRFDVTILNNISDSLTLDLGLETKESETRLLGLPYDFSPGSTGGLSKSTVASLGIQYQRRTTSNALSARLAYRKGLDALNATILPGNLPDGEFDMWQLQASYVLLIPLEKYSWTWSTRFNYQHSNDILQAFERFPLGGHGSVRGYRENQVLRDKAWELRTQIDFPLYKNFDANSSVTVFPFFDAGQGKNAQPIPNVVDSVSLRSIGLGVRWDYGGFKFLLEWASRLSEKRKQANELQDDGIHIGASYEF